MNKTEASKFSSWIFDSFQESSRGLGLYRIFCAFFILLFMLPSAGLYNFIGNLPADFFAPPPGPMMLFDGFPPAYLLFTLHYLLIAALVFLAIGFKTRRASLAVGVLLLSLKGFIYSIGKINHELLLAIVPLVMASSNWGKAYSIDSLNSTRNEQHDVQSWTLSLLALIVGFMMFTAGFPKILGGWLDLSTQATQGHYFKHYFVRERQDLLAPYLQYLDSFWWEIADYATVLFEISFLVAIINPKSTRIFICLAVIFHFSTMMALNISFLPNFLAYAAFLNWGFIDNKLRDFVVGAKKSEILGYWFPPAAICAGMVLLFAVIRLFYPSGFLESDWGMPGIIIVSGAVPVAVYYLLKQLALRR